MAGLKSQEENQRCELDRACRGKAGVKKKEEEEVLLFQSENLQFKNSEKQSFDWFNEKLYWNYEETSDIEVKEKAKTWELICSFYN